jgi:3',5'-cyclic AMP phosphodiesterase CpdA
MSRSEPKLLGRLQGMNQRFRILLRKPLIQNADLILVTGDITDRGDLSSWEIFWNEVKSSKLSRKVRAIPGNHDVSYLGVSKRQSNTQSRTFTDRMKVTKGLQLCNQQTRFPWCERFLKKVAIFGLNSNHAGNTWVGNNALGTLSKGQLSRLNKLLKENAEVPSKIVLVHHSPHVPLGEREELSLDMPETDRKNLQDVCVKNNVKLILHGHLHRNMNRSLGKMKIIGAPSSTEPTDKNTVGIYSFNIGIQSNILTSKLNIVALD